MKSFFGAFFSKKAPPACLNSALLSHPGQQG
jgi:hypothetical protein